MSAIDKRRHYVLVLDTETCNSGNIDGKMDMRDVLVYDCGWAIMDTHGRVYEKRSYLNRDIFFQESLMSTAYYSKKIPRYLQDLSEGKRGQMSTYELHREMERDIELYNITHVAAFNSRFDINALNVTRRYITNSVCRYWFPRNIVVWDIMKMARDTICRRKSYIDFCYKNHFTTKRHLPKQTVEVIWKYLTNNPLFQESHTGLEDVEIEGQIMAICLRQHKKMQKTLYKQVFPYVPPTDFQTRVMKWVREEL